MNDDRSASHDLPPGTAGRDAGTREDSSPAEEIPEQLLRDLAELRRERDELASQLALAREEISRLAVELDTMQQSPYWKAMTRFTSLGWLKRTWLAIPEGLRHRIKATLSGSPPPPPPGDQDEETGEGAAAGGSPPPRSSMTNAEAPGRFRDFLDRLGREGIHDLVLFVSGVKFVENEGQRGTQMARELLASGSAVVMTYFRWPREQSDPVPVSQESRVFQLPLDLMDRCRNTILSFDPGPPMRRTCIIEFPHPEAFQLVNELNAAGWHTVYDIIDDWEEFHDKGAAPWYEPAVEDYLCLNAGSLTAVVPKLVEKFRGRTAGREIHLVPNGVSPASFDMELPPVPQERGDLTVGYFGYLSTAWFDWDLLLDTAESRPTWQFHIIGYGDHPGREIPPNLHMHGKVDHERLHSYACSWDVGIVPFKESDLSRGADPIKVYEYLSMGLPVVVTGIPHLRDYPGVRVAGPGDDFAQVLEEAASASFPSEDVSVFHESCTWHRRALALLECPVDARLPEWLSGEGS